MALEEKNTIKPVEKQRILEISHRKSKENQEIRKNLQIEGLDSGHVINLKQFSE